MENREENVKVILREYDKKRLAAELKRDLYVEEINKKFPRLKEIRNEMMMLGLQNTQKILKNPSKSEEFKLEFNENLKRLDEEKKKILLENGISEDYAKPDYSCKLCNDTGYIENEKCECFVKKLIEKAYSQSNLGSSVEEQTFDKFSLDFYSSRKKEGSNISDREKMKSVLKSCVYFCENFDKDEKNILMMGKTGLGKTFLSNCIAREILNRGKTVIYIRATTLFSNYEDYRFGRLKEDFDFEKLYGCDLLIIDDLGSENLTKSSLSFFFDLLNERIDRNKKIIINTNFNMQEISKAYSTRITSRMYEHFELLNFVGEDIRIQKLKI